MRTSAIDTTPRRADVDTDSDLPVVSRDRGGLGAIIAASAVGGLAAAGLTWLVVATMTLELPMNALGL